VSATKRGGHQREKEAFHDVLAIACVANLVVSLAVSPLKTPQDSANGGPARRSSALAAQVGAIYLAS
jgi:hypothetical protein